MAGVKAIGAPHLCRVAGCYLCDPIWQVTLRSSVMDLSFLQHNRIDAKDGEHSAEWFCFSETLTANKKNSVDISEGSNKKFRDGGF